MSCSLPSIAGLFLVYSIEYLTLNRQQQGEKSMQVATKLEANALSSYHVRCDQQMQLPTLSLPLIPLAYLVSYLLVTSSKEKLMSKNRSTRPGQESVKAASVSHILQMILSIRMSSKHIPSSNSVQLSTRTILAIVINALVVKNTPRVAMDDPRSRTAAGARLHLDVVVGWVGLILASGGGRSNRSEGGRELSYHISCQFHIPFPATHKRRQRKMEKEFSSHTYQQPSAVHHHPFPEAKPAVQHHRAVPGQHCAKYSASTDSARRTHRVRRSRPWHAGHRP